MTHNSVKEKMERLHYYNGRVHKNICYAYDENDIVYDVSKLREDDMVIKFLEDNFDKISYEMIDDEEYEINRGEEALDDYMTSWLYNGNEYYSSKDEALSIIDNKRMMLDERIVLTEGSKEYKLIKNEALSYGY